MDPVLIQILKNQKAANKDSLPIWTQSKIFTEKSSSISQDREKERQKRKKEREKGGRKKERERERGNVVNYTFTLVFDALLQVIILLQKLTSSNVKKQVG